MVWEVDSQVSPSGVGCRRWTEWRMDCVYTALFSPVATQSAFQFCHSCTHSHTNGSVNHARRQPASSSGAVRVRCLAQGYLGTLEGARDRTSNLSATSQPALPPEPLAWGVESSVSARRNWCRSCDRQGFTLPVKLDKNRSDIVRVYCA